MNLHRESSRSRRDLLRIYCGLALLPGLRPGRHAASAGQSAAERWEEAARKHLESVMPARELVRLFVTPTVPGEFSANAGFTFDAELGWLPERSFRDNGVSGSKWFADYEADGARTCVHYAGAPCRIHTYGDSFTHCSQVNDGETWQEYLAAHIREPVRNYGVGGFSVYQAYRRMLLVEEKRPAPYIILNIYDDDHFRNLEAFRPIRWGGGGTLPCTLPHLAVDVGRGEFHERDNPVRRPEEAYRLCDKEFVWKSFKDDPTLKLMIASRSRKDVPGQWLEPPETIFGLPLDRTAPDQAAERLAALQTEAALYASRRTLELFERYAAARGKKLLVVLSFGRTNLRKVLGGEERFDRDFLKWIGARGYPVVDMLEAFIREFARSRMPMEDFIGRHYIGHHTPAGNHFTAMAMKDAVVRWLSPAPSPYR